MFEGRCPVQFEGAFLQDSGPQGACLAHMLDDALLTSLSGMALSSNTQVSDQDERPMREAWTSKSPHPSH